MLFGLGVLALGVLCFLGWSFRLRQWPFKINSQLSTFNSQG
jgi:hypothetical protein